MHPNDETTPTESEPMTGADYARNIAELRESTVSREEYDRVLRDNKDLARALLDGRIPDSEDADQPADSSARIVELKKRIAAAGVKEHRTDLEYFEDVLELRDLVIESGGRDPFITANKSYTPTSDDVAVADNVAQTLRECIDYADGDPDIFETELKRRIRGASKK